MTDSGDRPDAEQREPAGRTAYEKALWHVVAGWSFHDDECPATKNDDDDACTCGYNDAMSAAHKEYEALRGPPLEAPGEPSEEAARYLARKINEAIDGSDTAFGWKVWRPILAECLTIERRASALPLVHQEDGEPTIIVTEKLNEFRGFPPETRNSREAQAVLLAAMDFWEYQRSQKGKK